jgi:hypothetical protein
MHFHGMAKEPQVCEGDEKVLYKLENYWTGFPDGRVYDTKSVTFLQSPVPFLPTCLF